MIHAIQTAEEYLSHHETLYCLGDIVHNNEEVKRLTNLGLRVISYKQFQQLRDTTVLIRAHGEPPLTYQTAKENNITLIDATCPVVLKLQQRIADFYHNPGNTDKQILIFGKKGHAEVVGLMGQADNRVLVISDLDEIDRIDYQRPAMLYSQTTQGLEPYYELIRLIKERYEAAGNGELFHYADTICRKVANRTVEIAEFAKQHDAILFVSGEKSSNGLYLFDICQKNNPASFMISDPEQLDHLNLQVYPTIGICGATSTPMWLMEECKNRIINQQHRKMKRAIISVSDKTGIVPFAAGLIEAGYEIISTGGTKKALDAAGLKTIGISEITGFPEIMDGRVKTLHPKVHGGLLAIRDNEKHQQEMRENGIEPIDMIVVNLYPFKQTIEKPGVTYEDAIENIDIGGPTMLRSAAKNHKFVTVVVDAADYDTVLAEIKQNGDTTFETRRRLAAKVFRHTASYDTYISTYLTEQAGEQEPESITMTFSRKQSLRYGENPHQEATFYAGKKQGYSIAWAEQLHGKELSYNNIQDADATLQILKEFKEPAMVAVKHKNPCGVGLGTNALEAWQRAYEADPVSIFGGIVASNREIDLATAEAMKPVFLEIILAPSFTKEAFEHLATKKNIRLMTFDPSTENGDNKMFISVRGGMLQQTIDNKSTEDYELNVVTDKKPTDAELQDLFLAMKICKHVRSNAITVAKEGKIAGIGAGQMNRVGAAHIAFEEAKAKGITSGLCLASDAFFPFDDVVKMAAQYGVTAIIQPGGSVRDEDSIKACNELGIAMVFTGVRHFKH